MKNFKYKQKFLQEGYYLLMCVKEMEISAMSTNTWSEFCVKRVNVPLPDYTLYSDEPDHAALASFTIFCLNE